MKCLLRKSPYKQTLTLYILGSSPRQKKLTNPFVFPEFSIANNGKRSVFFW